MIRLAGLLLLGAAGTAAADMPPFPVALGGPYALTDHTGRTRTEAAPDGRAQMLFFGYANCEQICSAALPAMGHAAALLEASGHAVTPVMITVDPDRDTPRVMRRSLARHHPDFVGLTGNAAALQAAYDAFEVEVEVLFHDPAGAPVYAHGSFVYLLDPGGTVLTVIPPVLGPEDMARIAAPYLGTRGPGDAPAPR